jgi:hypothetical protein
MRNYYQFINGNSTIKIKVMTEKMQENPQRVKLVIDVLKDIEVDGETMQCILKEIKMDWQMLRQLMLTMPIEQVEYLIEERKDLGL